MTEQVPGLDTIKALPWAESLASFYIVKRRRLAHGRMAYDVLLVNVDPSVQDKLRTTFVERLNAAAGLEEYDFHTADQNDHLLTIPTRETDFQHVINGITGETAPPLAEAQEQLLDIWLYVARLDVPGYPPLFAVRKAPRGWATKKKKGAANLIFTGNMQLAIEPRDIFKIDDYYDFFSFSGGIFIFHKSAFETDMNFREGIVRDRNDLVAELDTLGLFQANQNINEMIGTNMRLLRKAAQVKRSGYFRDQNFLNELKRVNGERNLGLEYSNSGALIVTVEKIEFILHIFTNGRVESIINHEVFDVDAKRKVNG